MEGTPPRGLFLLASNHLSYLDIMVLGSLAPSLFVAKSEIRSWPLFGWISRGAGTLFVDRERPKDVVRVGGEMVERLEAGLSLTLFPEGKSTRGVDVQPFMPSLLEAAARTGVACHAVSKDGSRRVGASADNEGRRGNYSLRRSANPIVEPRLRFSYLRCSSRASRSRSYARAASTTSG